MTLLDWLASLLGKLLCRTFGHSFGRARNGVKKCARCEATMAARVRKVKAA